jgi:hypothetical protein
MNVVNRSDHRCRRRGPKDVAAVGRGVVEEGQRGTPAGLAVGVHPGAIAGTGGDHSSWLAAH